MNKIVSILLIALMLFAVPAFAADNMGIVVEFSSETLNVGEEAEMKISFEADGDFLISIGDLFPETTNLEIKSIKSSTNGSAILKSNGSIVINNMSAPSQKYEIVCVVVAPEAGDVEFNFVEYDTYWEAKDTSYLDAFSISGNTTTAVAPAPAGPEYKELTLTEGVAELVGEAEIADWAYYAAFTNPGASFLKWTKAEGEARAASQTFDLAGTEGTVKVGFVSGEDLDENELGIMVTDSKEAPTTVWCSQAADKAE